MLSASLNKTFLSLLNSNPLGENRLTFLYGHLRGKVFRTSNGLQEQLQPSGSRLRETPTSLLLQAPTEARAVRHHGGQGEVSNQRVCNNSTTPIHGRYDRRPSPRSYSKVSVLHLDDTIFEPSNSRICAVDY